MVVVIVATAAVIAAAVQTPVGVVALVIAEAAAVEVVNVVIV